MALILSTLSAAAEDAVVVEIGDTGLYLPNNAVSQDKHYLKQDRELLGRIACLTADVDSLLAELHALPPQLEGSVVTKQATANELPALIEIALDTNPEFGPLRSRLAVLAARTRQAGAKQDPMVSFMFGSFPLPELSAGDVPMTQYVVGWSQKYEGYGKRGLRRTIAGFDEELTQIELSQQELGLITDITLLYYDIVATKARLRVLEDNAGLLGLLIEFAERKYALGLTPQAMVLDAQLMLTKLTEQQISLENLLKRQVEMLDGKLGHPAGGPLESFEFRTGYPLPVAVEWDPDELLGQTLEAHPDNQWLETLIEQQQYRVELAHRNYRPDYTVTASYGMRYGKRDFISAGVSIPLSTHKSERQDAALQEAYASLDITEGRRDVLTNMFATRLGTLKVDLDRIVELSDLYREGLVPQARMALDSSIAGYAANRVDLADLLKSQQALLNYEMELEQLHIDYLSSLSELQLTTAGVFNPAPYLVLDLGTASQAAVSLPPGAEEKLAAEERGQVEALFIDEVPPPGINPGFIPGLGLPDPGVGQVEEYVPEDDGSADQTDDGFYAPFIPTKDEEEEDD